MRVRTGADGTSCLLSVLHVSLWPGALVAVAQALIARAAPAAAVAPALVAQAAAAAAGLARIARALSAGLQATRAVAPSV